MVEKLTKMIAGLIQIWRHREEQKTQLHNSCCFDSCQAFSFVFFIRCL